MRKSECAETVLDLIGRTPLLFLERFSNERVHIFAKLEGCNPGGSMKDRPALYMVELAERQGFLKPGGTIIESSSGNLGVALAMVGAVKKYHVKVVLDPRTSPTNIQIMKAYGAELIMVDQPHPTGGFQLARIEKVKQLTKETRGSYWPNQYANFGNPSAHYYGTAKEIYEDLEGQLDCLIAPVSSSGLLTGCGQFFKEYNDQVKIVAVDAEGSIIFGGLPKARRMIGIGGNITPANLRMGVVDEVIFVNDSDSYEMCQRLVNEEALLAGPSSGAAMIAALRIIPKLKVRDNRPLRVVVIFPDNGDRYLTTFLHGIHLSLEKAEILAGE